jgi:Flp pilus assembly protein TadG
MPRSNEPSIFKAFYSADRGSVALTFALLVIPLIGIAALAIDSGRAFELAQRTEAALDAAALAAAREMVATGGTDEEIGAKAERYLQANLTDNAAADIVFETPVVSIDRAAEEVTVELTTELQTTFGRVLGLGSFRATKSVTASFAVQDIELGIMLDVSGSMGSAGKLTDLKDAVSLLMDEVISDRPYGPKARIGLAPYATSVNAGSFASNAKGAGPGAVNRCVSERKLGAGAFDDSAPVPGKLMGGKPTSCPTSEIVALTSDRSTLDAAIAALSASGATAGHLGAAWAWYLVSPNWASFWPSESKPVAYNDKSAKKAVILMTDGMFNTQYEAENGNSATQALQLCENIKAAGVRVFTISFQAPSTVQPLMEACASGPDSFFSASDGSALKAAFKSIGETLMAIRLKS